jgi:hypothetical protein
VQSPKLMKPARDLLSDVAVIGETICARLRSSKPVLVILADDSHSTKHVLSCGGTEHQPLAAVAVRTSTRMKCLQDKLSLEQVLLRRVLV